MAKMLLLLLGVLVIPSPGLVKAQSGGWFLRVAVEPEVELCGPLKFFCPSIGRCIPRDHRCNEDRRKSCPKQQKCYSVNWHPSINVTEEDSDETENRFFIYRAYSSILESGSSGAASGGAVRNRNIDKKRVTLRQKRNVKQALRTLMFDPWKHSFAQYRGFVYEFGKYGVQELDINDPNYKYDREWTNGWEIVGVSGCVRSDVWRFIRRWNFLRGNYLWYANNCHHFTNAFIKYLKDDCMDHDVLE